MKKILKLSLIFSVLTLIFVGCSRDENGEDSTGYIRFKLNGEQRDYSYPVTEYAPPIAAVLSFEKSQNRNYQLDIRGFDKTKKLNVDAPGIDIYLRGVKSKNTNLTEGVYTSASNDNYILDCRHSIGTSEVYLHIGGNFTLKIKKLTKTHAKGTFSGVLKKNDGSGQTITITDGEFSLKVDYKETEVVDN